MRSLPEEPPTLLQMEPPRRFVTSTRLTAGDYVALVSPASWSQDEGIEWSVGQLESWGLQVRLGRHVRDRVGFLAGRDADRASDVNAALRDPGIRAIVAQTGGCGSLRLLHDVDRSVLLADPKPLIGFSDITALHRVWHAAGVASLHGCIDGSHADDVLHQLSGGPPAPVVAEPEGLTSPLTTSGTADGVLFGGSIEMLARSVGVLPFDLRGHILLLEANRAAGLGMVDRALTQLLLSGSLVGITGIAVGRFDGFSGYEDRDWNVLDVLRDRLGPLGVPVLGGLPIGHGPDPRTVPLGTPCRLDADRGILTAAPALHATTD